MRTSHAYGACRLVLRYSRLLPRLTCDRLSRNSFKTISQVFGVRRKILIFISDVDKVISALQNCWKVSSGLLEFNKLILSDFECCSNLSTYVLFSCATTKCLVRLYFSQEISS